jgi:hypothetical protein
LILAWLPCPARADVIDFEDLPLAPNSFYNGSDGAGGFVSRGASFNNLFTDFGGFTAWSGWSYSNVTDVTTPGFTNQYSAYNLPGGGGDRSATYGVGFAFNPGDAVIQMPAGATPLSARVTNTTYAALTMRDGDPFGFAKQFGGPTGTDPDYLLLTIRGLDAANRPTGSVDFYLADYRFTDSAQDYIVSTWTTVDLTPLGAASKLSFGLTSSDVGPFGINTPTYFALDNLLLESPQAVPGPGGLGLALVGAASALAWRRRARRPSRKAARV